MKHHDQQKNPAGGIAPTRLAPAAPAPVREAAIAPDQLARQLGITLCRPATVAGRAQAYLLAKPNRWITVDTLMAISRSRTFHSTAAELRNTGMRIDNYTRNIPTPDGGRCVQSWYCFVLEPVQPSTTGVPPCA